MIQLPAFYIEHRDHFKDRLFKRFGVIITNDEYDELCSSRYDTFLYETSCSCSIGMMEIKGVKVIVVRLKKNINRSMSSLKTVINPKDDYYFVPRLYQAYGINPTKFKEDIHKEMAIVKPIIKWLKESNGDTKSLFVNRPFDVDKKYLTAAYWMWKHDFEYPNKPIVENLYPHINLLT